MLKRLALVALVWACVSTAYARERFSAYCQRGGQKVVTQGLQSSGVYQRTFQSCTIHIFVAGTNTLASPLYSDNLSPVSTPLANPFTSAADGYFEFYAVGGRYDVQETFTDSTVNPPVTVQLTWGDILLCDPIGPNADAACTPSVPPPPSALTCNPNKVVDLYIDPSGNDSSGNGTIGSPWLTIQHAWDVGIPGAVDGRYIIHLKSPGTYTAAGSPLLSNKVFFNNFDYTNCATTAPPCSSVSIEGASATSETYIVESEITVDSGNVRLWGFQLGDTSLSGSVGVTVRNGAHVTLGAMTFMDYFVGLQVENDSSVFYENCGFGCAEGTSYVNNCNDVRPSCDTIRFDNGTISGVPFQANMGIEVLGGRITDLCDSNKFGNAATIAVYDGGGKFLRGIWIPNGTLVASNSPGVFVYGTRQAGLLTEGTATMDINQLLIDGTGTTGMAGIGTNGGTVSYAMWQGSVGNWQLKNLTGTGSNGINVVDYGGKVNLPTFTNVDTPIVGGNTSTTADPITISGESQKIDVNGRFVIAGYVNPNSSNVIFDTNQGNFFYLVLTKDANVADFKGFNNGLIATVIFKQDNSGNHNVVWNTDDIGGDTPSLTANTCSMQSFVNAGQGATHYWYATGPMLKGVTCP